MIDLSEEYPHLGIIFYEDGRIELRQNAWGCQIREGLVNDKHQYCSRILELRGMATIRIYKEKEVFIDECPITT